jgi:hypothetical protein
MARRFLLVLCVLLLATLRLARHVEGDAAAGSQGPAAPASVVFGPRDAPTSGSLCVGLFVPSPPTIRLVDRLQPGVLEAFERREAAGGALEAPIAPSEPAPPEPVPPDSADPFSSDRRREVRPTPDLTAFYDSLAKVAQGVRARTGVNVGFWHCPATRAEDVPLLLVPPGPIPSRDALALVRAADAGVRVEGGPGGTDGAAGRLALLGHKAGDAADEAALLEVVLDVLRTSPRITRQALDPLHVAAATREAGDVKVVLAAPPLEAWLEDLEGRVLERARVDVEGALRVSAPEPARNARATRLVATAQVAGLRVRRAWTVEELVGAFDRRVFAPAVAEAGSDFAPRVLVHDSRTGAAVVGLEQHLRLEAGTLPVVLAHAVGRTDAWGNLGAVLKVPESAPAGTAVLVVGEERLPVALEPGVRLSVVTERALYRPTDTVYVRLLAHRAGSGLPVADLPVTLTLGPAERRVTTSAHGIASARFRLEEAAPGHGEVVAKAGALRAQAEFVVRAFELPSFAVEVEPSTLVLRHGEQAPVRVLARYNDGAPVVDARVDAWGSTPLLPKALEGRTDAEGRAMLALAAGPRGDLDTLRVHVRDADGRVVRTDVAVRVAGQTARDDVDVEPLGDLFVGRAARFAIQARRAGVVFVALGDASGQVVALDAQGRGVIEVLPDRTKLDLRVSVGDDAPRVHSFPAATIEPGRLHAHVARRCWRVGEALALTLLGPDGTAYVDLDRGDLTLSTHAAVLSGGEARLEVPLPATHAGLLSVRVWRLAGAGAADAEPVGGLTRVLVLRGRSLEVEAQPRAATYRPGALAEVDVAVRDRQGRPVAGVLGYWGVDEALLRLAPWPQARETVFDVLPPWGVGAEAAEAAVRAEGGAACGASDLLPLVGAPAQAFDDLRTARRVRFADAQAQPPRVRAAVQAAFEASVRKVEGALAQAYARQPLDALRTASNLQQVLAPLFEAGTLAPEALRDPWGSTLDLVGPALRRSRRDGWSGSLHAVSAGPDLVFGTPDDLMEELLLPTAKAIGGRVGRFLDLYAASRLKPIAECLTSDAERAEWQLVNPGWDLPFEGPISNNLLGTGGGAGGAWTGRGASKGAGNGSDSSIVTSVHVRRDFDPTLVFVPETALDAQGRALLPIRLKDALTTWRLRLVASADDGSIGTAETALVATQPLAAEPWVAPHLTVGDVLDLPVALRNGTAHAETIGVRLKVGKGLQVVGPAQARVLVGPRGTGAVTFRLEAVAPGRASVRIDARGDDADLVDAVERLVTIVRDARPLVETKSVTVEEGPATDLALAPPRERWPTERRVSAFPSPMTEVIGGFEGLIACPHG